MNVYISPLCHLVYHIYTHTAHENTYMCVSILLSCSAYTTQLSVTSEYSDVYMYTSFLA